MKLNYKYFRCKECGKPFKRRTRSYAYYCRPCKKKVNSRRTMQRRAEKDPRVKLGVGSGGNQLRENNPYWKGGNSIYRKRLLEVSPELVCEVCGSDRFVVVHHKDGDRENGSLDNLQKLCRSCHRLEHERMKRLPK